MRALVTVALAVSLVSTSLALLCPSRSSSPLSLPSSSSSSSSRRAHLTRRRRQWATTPPSPDDLDAVMGFEPDTLPPRRTKRKMAWPFQRFDAPPLLDGTLACDCGFDPFRIAKSQKELFALREAEIKHARLAMLAAVGWPASELTHYTISKVLGLNDLLADNERAPSVLNGGLQNYYILVGLGTFFAVGSILELLYLRRRASVPESLRNFYDMWREDGWDAPGNYGFDPLSLGTLLCDGSDVKKVVVQSVEIFNGRVAMLATVGYAIQEAWTGVPVIRESPEFFYPLFLNQVVAEMERM